MRTTDPGSLPPPSSEPTDETLLARIARRDGRAFEIFYDRHASTVYGLLRRMVDNPAVADELLQETFWLVWERADQYARQGSPAAWLHRIARNKALDHLRRRKARPQAAEPPNDNDEESADWEPFLVSPEDVEETAQRTWDRENLLVALADLPEEQRQCLELAYFEGLTHREIAERTGIPLGTVKTRLRLGLEKLARSLRAQGYPVEEH